MLSEHVQRSDGQLREQKCLTVVRTGAKCCGLQTVRLCNGLLLASLPEFPVLGITGIERTGQEVGTGCEVKGKQQRGGARRVVKSVFECFIQPRITLSF